MKSALLLLFFGCFLAGTPPAHAAHSRHHAHGHRAHLKHSRFTRRASMHAVPAVRPSAPIVATPDFGPPHAITALAPPPSNAPEFGPATSTGYTAQGTAPLRSPERNTATARSLVQPRPSEVEQPTPPTELALINPPAVASPAVPLPDPLPNPVPVPQPERPAPALRFNHPTPIPLPAAPATEPPATAAPATPEHEDDDEPLAMMTGGGSYVGIARVNHARPFQPLTPMRGYDLAISGTAVFSHTLTATGLQSMDPTAGVFLTAHHHTDKRWLDIEAHYGLNKSSSQFIATGALSPSNLSVLSQEFTGDLLFRRHLNRARPYQALPYLGVGGGVLYFKPSSALNSQLAPTALLDSGVDIPTNNQHISFRLGSHLLFYRAPTFGTAAASGWTLSAQPAAGVLFHF